MRHWCLFLVSLTAIALALSVAAKVGAQESGTARHSPPSLLYEWWNEVLAPSNRGVAIMAPADSRDGYEPAVGGQARHVQYYRGYLWRGYPLSIGGYARGYGLAVPQLKLGETELGGESRVPANYGSYSGARQDEANLLLLGGFTLGHKQFGETGHGRAMDLIDMIREEGKTEDKPIANVYSAADDRGAGNGLVSSAGQSGSNP